MTYTPPPTPRRPSVPLPTCDDELPRPSTARLRPAQLAPIDTKVTSRQDARETSYTTVHLSVTPATPPKLRRSSSPLHPSVGYRARSPLLLLFDLEEDPRAIAPQDGSPKASEAARSANGSRMLSAEAPSLSPTLDQLLGRRRGLTITQPVSPIAQQRRMYGALGGNKMGGHAMEQSHLDAISA